MNHGRTLAAKAQLSPYPVRIARNLTSSVGGAPFLRIRPAHCKENPQESRIYGMLCRTYSLVPGVTPATFGDKVNTNCD
jgi:hypothetical protein